ncbi:copper chaperone PCu(A)C [Pelagibacterium limicola]|uniref:copper chaperone PCu(A)C n=1 Tax=Pelagibacterium limicola TaxID=2791022 RepID=UPI0018AFA9DD|nr:copper chaperone PCu(A)C [Pelagibacterium limicola]
MKIVASGILLISLLGAVPAFAHDAHAGRAADIIRVGDLELSGAFTRATLPNQPVGAGYLTITNGGETEDRLIGGSAAFAGDVQIHEMAVVNDVMNMRELPDGLAIPAGESVVLTPGGLHIMFLQLQQALVEGEPVAVTLEFANAGTVEVEFVVAPAGAREMPAGHHGH